MKEKLNFMVIGGIVLEFYIDLVVIQEIIMGSLLFSSAISKRLTSGDLVD